MDDFEKNYRFSTNFYRQPSNKKSRPVTQYTLNPLEVLSGFRSCSSSSSMYTDTSHLNHFGAEVIDNAVDKALTGHANQICVTVYEDGSLS